MQDCLFCKMAAGHIPAQFIFEDPEVFALKDITPQAPTHLLIIPHKHIATLNDASDQDTNLLGHMLQVAKQLAKEHRIADAGYRTLFNCNENGGQALYHIHLHLLGGRALSWPPG